MNICPAKTQASLCYFKITYDNLIFLLVSSVAVLEGPGCCCLNILHGEVFIAPGALLTRLILKQFLGAGGCVDVSVVSCPCPGICKINILGHDQHI